MSEDFVVAKTESPITIVSLSRDLEKLGVKRGDVLLVHSSLSSLGWVCGGAQSVIMALVHVLGEEGTLVMPAHSGDWTDPAEWRNPPVPKEWLAIIYQHLPAYDRAKTPSRGMGRIAELFRTFPNTYRSNHPQVSFTANGRLAEQVVRDHVLTPQFGLDSPIGRMYTMDADAKVLLLGAGYDSCSCFHLAETMLERMPTKQLGTALFDQGERVWRWFNDYDYDTHDFNLLGQNLEEDANVRKGRVGQAQCRLFDLKEAVDFAQSWFDKHRF